MHEILGDPNPAAVGVLGHLGQHGERFLGPDAVPLQQDVFGLPDHRAVDNLLAAADTAVPIRLCWLRHHERWDQ